MSPSLACGLSRRLIMAVVVWGTLSAPSAAGGQTQNVPVDAYADTQAFIRAVYPELAQPRRYVIWFETFRLPMEALVSSTGRFTVFVGPPPAIPARPDLAPTSPPPVLRAIVRVGPNGRVLQFSTSGSPITNGPKRDAVQSLVAQHRPTTDEQFRRLIESVGAKFPPGMERALLEHVASVVTEVERRWGKLTVTDTTPPMLNPADRPASTPSPYLSWSVSGRREWNPWSTMSRWHSTRSKDASSH